jgi:cytosine/adenosine deaminase-related metal-dependent hydrolase
MQIYEADVVLPITDSPITPGAIAIDGDTITAIGTSADVKSKYPEAKTIDLGQTVIMPGLVNCHTHLQLTDFKHQILGTIFDKDLDMPRCSMSFIDWIIALIVYKRQLTDETVRQAISHGISKSISAGTTSIGEITNLESEFAFFRDKDIRTVIYPELISYNPNQAQELYDNAHAMIESEDFQGPLLSVGISPHSPFTVSRSLLKISGQFARESSIPLQIHVSESFAEMEFFFDAKGEIATKLFPLVGWDDMQAPCHMKTPIQYLSSLEFFSPLTTLVHCVHVTDNDLDKITQSNASVIHCPRSNFFLSNGRAPLEKFLERDVKIGLGTDSMASNTSLSLWDEMRFAQAIHEENGKVNIPASVLLEMATINGAHILGKGNQTGSLEVGKKADIIGIDLTDFPEGENFYEYIVDNTHENEVVLVMINGKIVKER